MLSNPSRTNRMMKSLGRAAHVAASRAFDVCWAGIVALMFWIALITVGPVVQGRLFPVVSNFRLTEITQPGPDLLSFRPAFVKEMDCEYLGLTWFVKDDKGQVSRHQVSMFKTDGEVQGPPVTGPVGPRIGVLWEVPLKDQDREMFGLLHHSCGFPWESRTLVGPFVLSRRDPNTIGVETRR
jgi:hypothetical protein